jgi:hypothetical protein
VVSDEIFAKREERWSFDIPDTKEAYLFREIFDGKQLLCSVLVVAMKLRSFFFFRVVPN